ncbi:MAG: acyltransferase family protein [Megasphaera sp.]|mgnify:FL=1|nr:acyltransferase family protein [Megasphaera sp.]
MGRHIYYLDNLRTCAIFLSLLAIALGTFMPEPLMPAYYISDMQAGPRWGALYYEFHELLMALVIPILFFLSGYFAASNLRIRVTKLYMKSRFKRLFLPWLFASIFFVTETAWLCARTRIPSLLFGDFMQYHFFGPSFTQGATGILLPLFLCSAVLVAAKAGGTNLLKRLPAKGLTPFTGSLFVLIHLALTVGVFFLWLYLFRVDAARMSSVFYSVTAFRISWFITAIFYFGLGVYGATHRWFTTGGFLPKPYWAIAGAVMCLIFLAAPPYFRQFLAVFLAFFGTFGAIALFSLFGNQSTAPFIHIAALSYPIWYIAVPAYENAAYFLTFTTLPSFVKLVLALALSLIYSYVLAKYALSRLSCFKA